MATLPRYCAFRRQHPAEIAITGEETIVVEALKDCEPVMVDAR